MVTAELKRLQDFDLELNSVVQNFLSAEGIGEAIPNRPFLTLVTKTCTKEQHFNRRKVLRRLNDDMSTVVSTEVLQKLSQEE